MKMARSTVTHVRGVAGQNLMGFSMWHRADRGPKKIRQLHRSISRASKSVDSCMVLNDLKIARASVSVSCLGDQMARATVLGGREVERQKHKVFNKSRNGPFHSCTLERGRMPKTQCFLLLWKSPVRQLRAREGSRVKNTVLFNTPEAAALRVPTPMA